MTQLRCSDLQQTVSSLAALCLLGACLSTPLAATCAPPVLASIDQAAVTPKVIDIASEVPCRPSEAGLGDRFTLVVENLAKVLEEAHGCNQVVLFLGGMPVPGAAPERCDPDNGHVGFFLEHRAGSNDRTWSALLGSPTSLKKPVRVTIGSSHERSIETLIQPGGKLFWLVMVRKSDLVVFIILLVTSLASVILLAKRSALLREPGSRPAVERIFSISRFQLAFWSILVAEAYLFVWVLSGRLDTITESVLALMGIGSGTALGAALIDSGNGAKADPARTSQGFLQDVLSDANGVSIHRFQVFVWTLILGIIFCSSVYKTLDMPEFSATLLALMGISSGTFLAFKFPENKAAANPR